METMLEFLEGFEQRMGFVAVVDSIVNRRNKNSDIESWFEGEELDNIFFSLLVYIMEQTLSENEECTMENMAAFLDDILPLYGKSISFDQVTRLAEYMVKDIFQNKGMEKSFGIIHYDKGMFRYPVRLINDKITEDNRIIYQLTDQGYDFLFRTREVDRELDFKMEQIKLKQLLKRRNYRHALKQSRELVSMLRQKKHEVEDFINRVKQNIHTIDRGEHEKLLKETYELIDEEYEGMLELKDAVDKDEERIIHELEDSGFMDETMKAAIHDLGIIKRNLQLVIGEQRNLIGKRFSMNDTYEEIIKNSFYAAMNPRFDMETELMEPLKLVNEQNISRLWMLLNPLFFPQPDKKLNLSLLYERQGKLKESETGEELIGEEVLLEDKEAEKKKHIDDIHVRMMGCIFKYAGKRKGAYTCSELFHHMEERLKEQPEVLASFLSEKRFFLMMLKLYNYGNIDISMWNEQKEELIPSPNGEFDLAYCLNRLEQKMSDFYGVECLTFEKTGEHFTVLIQEESVTEDGMTEKVERKIVMDDILVRPKLCQEVKTDGKSGASDLQQASGSGAD